jgi:thiamine biosynthesis lipoprotein
MPDAERHVAVMGTTAHVVVVAGNGRTADDLADRAVGRLHQLEARWSRFLPTSEVSACNAAMGAPVIVSADTQLLVQRAVDGWRRTHGRFDPTVHDSMLAVGYDRDFDAIDRAAPDPVTTVPAPGCAGIVVDRVVGAVRLPRGARFDPGGIGKGLAADLVAEELRRDGAAGVCVNVGGDLRVEGLAPGAAGWVVDVDHPVGGPPVASIRLGGGAVASTWRTRRRWGPPEAERHHLVDPTTGAPARSGLAGVAVVAGRAWWAEVVAKAAFVDGPAAGRARIEAHGLAGYLVDDAGAVHSAGPVDAFSPRAGVSLGG